MATRSLVRDYFEFARTKYTRWGALGLVAHLERRYPNILAPALSFRQNATDLVSIESSMISSHEDPTEL
eukprot:CAMPEP_0176167692 /NCGR_PEP_ID=MMETSP0120_2-20121206/85807_1 /TAXON_ID=160619 /ORGANISM="Kryptoperidinium foliaceum, Strain CCMP 1326" /LENGTH=68 /DNA_ID=CAMNT_0017505347 /DNA_START=1 /DNA_END=203 /DNA_ORIENTATION=+